MQGTQYAPRESILCMEHFVALQCSFTSISSLCIRTVHALTRLCECAGSSEPSLFAYAIFTIIS